MINLHLLTRISGNDAEFRTYFLRSLNKQADQVISQLDAYCQDQNWASAYLLLEHYSNKIQPYAQPGYFSDLRASISSIPKLANELARLETIRGCIHKLEQLTAPQELYGAVALSA
jgi:hypothetical protein